VSAPRRILITGGAGFVGFHLATELSAQPEDELTLVDNFVRGRQDPDLEGLLKKSNVRLVSADVTRPETFENLGTGYDEVYHLAAIIGVRNVLERPHEVVRVNAVSTLLLLDWFCRGGGTKLLFSSTSEAYAWTQCFHQLPIPTPEDVPLALTDLSRPRASYAGSKIFGELAVNQYCRIYSKSFVIVRYHNVYGPRMGYEHVIPELYLRAAGGESPLVVYSAEHRRAFCYASDAVAATVAAMRSPAADGLVLNVGDDREDVEIARLARVILRQAGLKEDILPQPAPHDPIKRRCPDISRARKLLGYEPRTDLETGVARTIAWYSVHPRP
jgi:nucleoside-diphosphate-sugar epimerase